jgi:Legume-like lectin family
VIRFEYKYSFKPPYLAQKDGSVPFFEYSGNAIASEEMVRITPSLRSQKGTTVVLIKLDVKAKYVSVAGRKFF